jgi:hypothetical protein
MAKLYDKAVKLLWQSLVKLVRMRRVEFLPLDEICGREGGDKSRLSGSSRVRGRDRERRD